MSRPRDIPLPGGSVSRTVVGGSINYEAFSIPSFSIPSVGSSAPLTTVDSTPSFTAATETRGLSGPSTTGTGYAASVTGVPRIGSRSLLEIPLRTFSRFSSPIDRDRFRGDRLNITQTRIENNEFVNVVQNGISNVRPEIIASTNFSPIWKPTQLNVNNVLLRDTTDIGDYISFQYQTKLLRQETLQALIANISNVLPTNPFKSIKTDFDNEIRSVGSDLVFLNSVLSNINTINNSIDIKNIPDSEFRIKENGEDVVIPTLEKIYTNRMQYSTWQYKNFSETKVLLQLLFDLQNILTNYSVNLINLRDNDRAGDRSPTVLDKTYTLQNGFTFKISDFKSSNTLVNAFQIFEQFCTSLPQEPDSIIKLLTYLISKEYLISTGLGNTENSAILTKYQGGISTTGILGVPSVGINGSQNIFENIIGNVGDTIFQPQSGNQAATETLASLMYIDPGLGSNILVLPFENRYVQTDDQTITYVPGTAYFTDAIIKTDGTSWNITPYQNFTTNFNRVFSNAKSAINKLLNLYSFTRTGEDTIVGGTSPTVISALSPSELNSLYVEKFQTSFKIAKNFNQSLNDQTEESLNLQIQSLEEQARNVVDELLWERDPRRAPRSTATSAAERIERINSSLDRVITIRNQINDIKRQIIGAVSIQTRNDAFSMALFNEASNDVTLKKYILFMCFFAGLYRNAASSGIRSDFFMKLVENEFKTFGDIFAYMPNTSDVVSDSGATYSPSRYANISLNPNSPDFDAITCLSVFQQYMQNVIAPYIKGIINNVEQTVESGRSEESSRIRDPGFFGNAFFETPVCEVDNIGAVLLDIIINTGGASSTGIFHQVNDLIEQAYNSTKLSNQVVHVTSNGKTKYNNLSTSMQFLFFFETFIQYSKKYSGLKLRGVIDKVNYDTVSEIENSVQRFLISSSSFTERQSILEAESAFFGYNKTSTKYVVVNIDTIKQYNVQNAFDYIKNGNPPDVSVNNVEEINTQEYHDLYDNHNKITQEFNTIKDVVGILEVININLQDSYRVVNDFFKQERLQQFLTTSTINNIDFLRYPSQIRLANQIYNDIVEKTTYGVSGALVTMPGGAGQPRQQAQPLIVSDVIVPSEYNAMISMLSSNISMFQTIPDTDALSKTISRNSKIVTIGIPTGFSKKLTDRVSITNLNRQGGSSKQSDVIAINIYPNDIRFGEIVLKPYTYLFDLSLFLGKKQFVDLSAQNGELFSTLIQRIKLKDYENPYDVKELLRQDILTDDRYSFLSTEQKNDLFNNAVISYLLGTYVNCLTGIQYSEDVFINPATKRVLNPKTADAVKSYLLKEQQVDRNERDALGVYNNTEDILNNSRFTEKYKDTYRLMTYGSLVFNDKEVSKRVNSSKIFDRVFHIPVRLNSLEIDLDATNSTVSGRESLVRAATQAAIVTEGGRQYMVTNEPNDFIIKDIFCAAIQTDTGTGAGLYWSPVSDYIGAAIGRGTIAQELGATEGFRRLQEAISPFIRPGSFSSSSPLIPGGSR